MGMIDGTKQHVFFVDDEFKIRKVVDRTLKQLGVKVHCFASAPDCLEQLACQRCDLLIADVRMPGMDGLELLTEARRIVPWLPVLIVTGYGDIPMAVKALKIGALDFIEKPLETKGFISAVESALDRTLPPDSPTGQRLTRTEMRVLGLILEGRSNRETACHLHRSVKTIEVHRNHIMHKLGVGNVVDLVKQAATMGLADLPGQ